MVETGFIKERLERVQLYCGELERLFEFPLREIRTDFIKLRAAERIFQLIVDEILDVNNHFISRLKLEYPQSFQSTFRILGTCGILPEKFVEKIAPVVGLRNRLVHRYEELDSDVFLGYVNKEKGDFKKYGVLIEDYIRKNKLG